MMNYKRDLLNGKRQFFFSISKKVHMQDSQVSVGAWGVVRESNEKEIACTKTCKACIKNITLGK